MTILVPVAAIIVVRGITRDVTMGWFTKNGSPWTSGHSPQIVMQLLKDDTWYYMYLGKLCMVSLSQSVVS